MTERRTSLSDADLEAALTDLGRHLAYGSAPDVSEAVRDHVERHPTRRLWLHRPTVLYPIIAAVVLIALALTLSAGNRSAVASWFRIVGVQIEFGSPPPGPLGRTLHLGARVSLAQAQRHVAFPILVPGNLRPPDEVYTGTPPLSGSVSLLYQAGPGLRRSSTTHVGLLITEYQRYFLDVKLLPRQSVVIPVRILGYQAVWLGGVPHAVYDLDRHGRRVPDTIRLAGNVLLWYRSGITIRMEGQISLEQAVAIARSMRSGIQR